MGGGLSEEDILEQLQSRLPGTRQRAVNAVIHQVRTSGLPERVDFALRAMLRNDGESVLVRGAIVQVYREVWRQGRRYRKLDELLLGIWIGLGPREVHGGPLATPIQQFFVSEAELRTYLIASVGSGLLDRVGKETRAALLSALRSIIEVFDDTLEDAHREVIGQAARRHHEANLDSADAISWRIYHRGIR